MIIIGLSNDRPIQKVSQRTLNNVYSACIFGCATGNVLISASPFYRSGFEPLPPTIFSHFAANCSQLARSMSSHPSVVTSGAIPSHNAQQLAEYVALYRRLAAERILRYSAMVAPPTSPPALLPISCKAKPTTRRSCQSPGASSYCSSNEEHDSLDGAIGPLMRNQEVSLYDDTMTSLSQSKYQH